jgi:hypothetical protein
MGIQATHRTVTNAGYQSAMDSLRMYPNTNHETHIAVLGRDTLADKAVRLSANMSNIQEHGRMGAADRLRHQVHLLNVPKTLNSLRRLWYGRSLDALIYEQLDKTPTMCTTSFCCRRFSPTARVVYQTLRIVSKDL